MVYSTSEGMVPERRKPKGTETMNSIKITQAEAKRRPVKGWMKVTGIDRDQRDAICCVATTREMNGHLLFAEKDMGAVKARLGL
jgi:hypothetical protein